MDNQGTQELTTSLALDNIALAAGLAIRDIDRVCFSEPGEEGQHPSYVVRQEYSLTDLDDLKDVLECIAK